MSGVVLIVRLVLAAIFLVSAVAKFWSLKGSRQAALDLGVPKALAPAVGLGLPLVELATAAALVPTATARWGGAAGAVLLLLFAGMLALNMAAGRRPSCHCFGELSRGEISWATVARNVVLAAAAGLVWAVEPSGFADVARGVSAAEAVVAGSLAVLATAVVLQGWALVHVVRQHGRVLLRLKALEESAGAQPTAAPAAHHHGSGLPVGQPAPEFSLVGLHGETMTLAALRSSGRPVLLVFSDPGCGPCTALAPDLARWQTEHADRLRIAVVAAGSSEAIRAGATEHGVSDVLIQNGHQVADAYRYQGTPGAVLVDVAGRIASPLASGGPAITALVTRIVHGVPVALGRQAPAAPVRTPAPAVGAEAPNFTLPLLGGGEASLSEFRGRDVMLLFWNPRCGFCQQLRPDLLAWEQERPPDAPELLVISTGDMAANTAERFASPVFLDEASSAMAAYGASGTPMAIAVDAAGWVASPLEAGAPGVKQLLTTASQQGVPS